MNNEWMLDVLADLRAFATRNGLNATGKQLDLAAAVAAAEMASKSEVAQRKARRGTGNAGELHREVAGGSHT